MHNYHVNTYAHLVLCLLQIHPLIVSCETVLSEIFLHRAEKEKSEATESRIQGLKPQHRKEVILKEKRIVLHTQKQDITERGGGPVGEG